VESEGKSGVADGIRTHNSWNHNPAGNSKVLNLQDALTRKRRKTA